MERGWVVTRFTLWESCEFVIHPAEMGWQQERDPSQHMSALARRKTTTMTAVKQLSDALILSFARQRRADDYIRWHPHDGGVHLRVSPRHSQPTNEDSPAGRPRQRLASAPSVSSAASTLVFFFLNLQLRDNLGRCSTTRSKLIRNWDGDNNTNQTMDEGIDGFSPASRPTSLCATISSRCFSAAVTFDELAGVAEFSSLSGFLRDLGAAADTLSEALTRTHAAVVSEAVWGVLSPTLESCAQATATIEKEVKVINSEVASRSIGAGVISGYEDWAVVAIDAIGLLSKLVQS